MIKTRNTGAKAVAIILSALLAFGFLAWMYDSGARYQAARPAIVEAEGQRSIDESIARQLDAGTAALRADTAIASGAVVVQWAIIGGLLLAEAAGFVVGGLFIWGEVSARKTK